MSYVCFEPIRHESDIITICFLINSIEQRYHLRSFVWTDVLGFDEGRGAAKNWYNLGRSSEFFFLFLMNPNSTSWMVNKSKKKTL